MKRAFALLVLVVWLLAGCSRGPAQTPYAAIRESFGIPIVVRPALVWEDELAGGERVQLYRYRELVGSTEWLVAAAVAPNDGAWQVRAGVQRSLPPQLQPPPLELTYALSGKPDDPAFFVLGLVGDPEMSQVEVTFDSGISVTKPVRNGYVGVLGEGARAACVVRGLNDANEELFRQITPSTVGGEPDGRNRCEGIAPD